MTWKTIADRAAKDEVRRSVLREAEERYRNELMDSDERELLWNRILRLRRALALA